MVPVGFEPTEHRILSTVALPICLRDRCKDGVGFEPTDPGGSPVFKTGAIDHSAIHPQRQGWDSNPRDVLLTRPLVFETRTIDQTPSPCRSLTFLPISFTVLPPRRRCGPTDAMGVEKGSDRGGRFDTPALASFYVRGRGRTYNLRLRRAVFFQLNYANMDGTGIEPVFAA